MSTLLDVEISAETVDDRAATHGVVSAAFVDEPVVADLVEALRESTAWIDGLSFVAKSEGRVVGHVLVTRALLDAPRRLVDVLVLSPLAVAPAVQRRGVGARLVRHCLDVVATRPEPALFLEGSPRYYGRFGFEPAVERGFRRPSLRIPKPAFQVKLLPAYQGWMTGTLVYAEPFWRFDCVGLREEPSG